MKLRIIPTKTHAAVDMATGPALVAAPTLLRMNGNTGATIPPRVVGSLATAYSLKRVVPMRAHLALDALGGVALAATPFLTGASKKGYRHWLPHALIGANEVFLALTTKEHPPSARRFRAYAPKAAIGAATLGAVAAAVLAGRHFVSDDD
jgi:hypothetical protein